MFGDQLAVVELGSEVGSGFVIWCFWLVVFDSGFEWRRWGFFLLSSIAVLEG